MTFTVRPWKYIEFLYFLVAISQQSLKKFGKETTEISTLEESEKERKKNVLH